jgi:CheY-like chemotaxis protein
MYNLLSNALKFTPHSGWIKIRFSFSSIDGGRYAIIEVINLGDKIIPEEDRDIIFLPFRQGKAYNAGGTGIGLAYSKGLVELHNGFITVDSIRINDAEYNTVFKIGLPLAPEETVFLKNETPGRPETNVETHEFTEHLPDLTLPDIAATTGNTKLPVILLVEDNVDMRAYLKDYFSGFYTVLEAAEGSHGLEIAFSQLPDIIISDVMMDGMDGYEFCSLLKTDARTSHIPVVLLTAQTPVEAELQGIETGADDYITKPFNLATLSARVKNLLALRKKLKEKYRREISIVPNEDVTLSADEKMLQKLLNFVESRVEDPGLGVDEICIGVGVSKSQLYKKVRELTGLSLLDIIKEIRLKKAKQLLSLEKFTVNEIASMVGFSDTDYFRKCFKSEFAMTPTEYVKSLSSGKGNSV